MYNKVIASKFNLISVKMPNNYFYHLNSGSYMRNFRIRKI